MDKPPMIPRLRAVRFKSGGYLRVMQSPRVAESRILHQQASESVDHIWLNIPDKIVGYAMVAWAADGDIGGCVRISEGSPFLAPSIPGIMAEEVRRILTGTQIKCALGDDNHDAV